MQVSYKTSIKVSIETSNLSTALLLQQADERCSGQTNLVLGQTGSCRHDKDEMSAMLYKEQTNTLMFGIFLPTEKNLSWGSPQYIRYHYIGR